MSKPILWGKIEKKTIINLSSAEYAQRVEKVKVTKIYKLSCELLRLSLRLHLALVLETTKVYRLHVFKVFNELYIIETFAWIYFTYWFRDLFSTSPIPLSDLEVKITDLQSFTFKTLIFLS